MRELERDLPPTPASVADALSGRFVVVGRGRAGGAIAGAARAAGLDVALAGRADAAAQTTDAAIVLLCVPDDAIAAAAETVAGADPAPRFVGHTSGASGLDELAPATAAGAQAFSLHPLQTIPSPETDLAGAPCAIAGETAEAEGVARALAERLGMEPFAVPEESRAAYHAAASMASNFLIALQESAAELMRAAGVEDPRAALAPLVLRTAANWSEAGAEALTGPIARGDEGTVRRHLEALREHAPHLASLYEELAERTRAIARGREEEPR
ncbi:MAG TPA: DUF2520 domain-containing protein [Solirubrobacterales bacterium]|jgi:predicted short-subunit dehydrogenase-like oxidoreductase (DUF2520 family)